MGNCKHMCHSREVVLTHTSNNVVMEAWNGCWTSGASSQKSNGDVFSCCVWEASGHSENTTKTVWSNASQTHPGSGLIDQTMLNLHVVIPSAKTHLKTKQGLRASPELRWTDGGDFTIFFNSAASLMLVRVQKHWPVCQFLVLKLGVLEQL